MTFRKCAWCGVDFDVRLSYDGIPRPFRTARRYCSVRCKYDADNRRQSVSRGVIGEVDDIAVERACRGDRSITLNRAELLAAFTYLDAHGYSAAQMGARLGVTSRTIQRWQSGDVRNPQKRAGVARSVDVRKAA